MPPLQRLRSLLRGPSPTRSDARRAHVCQIVDRLVADGVGSCVAGVCNGLDPRRFVASCLGLGPRDPLALGWLEPRVETWAPVGSTVEQERQVAGILARYGVDLVHAHGARALGVAAHAARRRGLPLVVTGRGGPLPRAAASAAALLATTEKVADQMARALGVARERIAIVPTGVDTERFRPPYDRSLLRQSLGLVADELVIGGVGDAATVERISAELGVRGVVVGVADGEGGGARVTVLPRVRDIESVLGALDILIFSGVGDSPPVTVLQAMACGLAVVATASAGAAAVIDDEATGALVASAAELRAAVARLSTDSGLRQALGRAARRKVERDHSLAAMVDPHARLYASLLPEVASF